MTLPAWMGGSAEPSEGRRPPLTSPTGVAWWCCPWGYAAALELAVGLLLPLLPLLLGGRGDRRPAAA